MDTPDKAAGLADPQLADSSNREWLVTSARSSQLSVDLRQYQFECSLTSSLSDNATRRIGGKNSYGTLANSHGVNNEIGITNDELSETSWLKRHYITNERKPPGNHELQRSKRCNVQTATYTINNHIYDNISFAESPILRSLSRKGFVEDLERQNQDNDCPAANYKSADRLQNTLGPGSGLIANKFRYFLACYVLVGITLAIYSRNALSLASVGMVANNAMNKELNDALSQDRSPQSDQNSNPDNLFGACPIVRQLVYSNNANRSQTNYIGKSQAEIERSLRLSIDQRVSRGELVDWSPGEQGLIFAAGSVGNLLIGIPLTRLGEIYGPKWIIFVASLGATMQAAFMPIISPCNVVIVILFQVIFNGLTFGADCVAYTLFAYWLTPTEMAFFVSCLLICYQFGTILSSFATARILSDNLPWSWCFYAPAILCGIWTLIWMLVGASEPSKSRLISRQELDYLERNNKIAHTLREPETSNHNEAAQIIDGRKGATTNEQLHSISWIKLCRDPNIWAICAVKFTLRWYFSAYLSLMPTYLSSVAHMSVDTIGKMSVVQSFIGLFSGILMGFLTKSLVTKRPFNMSLATTRKFFQSIVNFGLVLSLIVFISYDCNQWVTIITLTLGGICINFYVAAALQLPLDLSPNHCGLITSITNTLAFGQALGAPISGLILNNGPKDRALWRLVWLVAIVLNLFSGIIFIILVDSKPRDYRKSEIPLSRNKADLDRQHSRKISTRSS